MLDCGRIGLVDSVVVVARPGPHAGSSSMDEGETQEHFHQKFSATHTGSIGDESMGKDRGTKHLILDNSRKGKDGAFDRENIAYGRGLCHNLPRLSGR